jgi:PIN domain nuclease of toxin-antitoxin system
MTQYVLDTSALLTYIENEEGATEVEALLQKALDAEAVLYISMVSCIEVFILLGRNKEKKWRLSA